MFPLLLAVFSAVNAAVTPYEAYGLTADAILETVSVVRQPRPHPSIKPPLHPPPFSPAQTADGGIKKHILKLGDGAAAQKGQTVSAHYDGKLAADGKQFDSSRNRGQPFTFPLGGGRVIKGWDEGFATMSVGEKAILEIAPEYGYGARGAGGVIPGGATLYFEVELMGLEGGGAPKKKAHHHHHHHGHDHSHHDHDHDEM